MDFFTTAQRAFVIAVREDLGYTARWWQLLRKRKEKRYRQRGEFEAGLR
ncbi:hypothetical protein [Kitasatospora sp. NPDC059599]